MDFIIQCFTVIGVLFAVAVVLFGERIRNRWDPIKLSIEKPPKDRINDHPDEEDLEGGKKRWVYCNHLCVINAGNRAIENCRVWLDSIEVKKGDSKAPTFGVGQLMEWAPSEYSRAKRTFRKQQVFDLGKSLEEGFDLTIDRRLATVKKQLPPFPPGTIIQLVFYATADNYFAEEKFKFEITVPELGGDGKPQPVGISLLPSPSTRRDNTSSWYQV